MNIAIDLVGTNLGSGTKTYNLKFLQKISKFNSHYKIYIFCCNDYTRYIDLNLISENIFIKAKPNFYLKITLSYFGCRFCFHLNCFLNIDKLFSPMNYCPIICKVMKLDIILGIHSNLPWVFFDKMPGNKIKIILSSS